MNAALLNEAWRLHQSGRLGDAERLYREVLAADPANFEALFRFALLLGQQDRFAEAQHHLGTALRFAPSRLDGWLMRAFALRKLGALAEALECLDRALALDPRYAEARLNRAAVLARMQRYDEAATDYARLLALAPEYPFARGSLMFCRLHCCEWRDFETEKAALVEGLHAGRRVVAPFNAKVLSLAPADELAAARLWIADKHPEGKPLWSGERYAHDRIRVAYVSADFCLHPVAAAIAGVLEHHDRSRFEVSAISVGRDDGSAIRKRIAAAPERFVDLASRTDSEIAAHLRESEIDIAVDLTGLTADGRDIFSRRPAPVQVNYLGFPGTMGASYMDYIVADGRVVAPEEEEAYPEKPIYLPDTYLPTDGSREVSRHTPSRADAGLPESGFVFCCFNASYKILPRMFDVWMRLLRAVDGSVLWFNRMNDIAVRNLRREAQARGVSSDRLVFGQFVFDPAGHIARLRLADLFLDTLPYNAHVTACDALWAGVPVLTSPGTAFAGRVGASLLHAARLPELVAASLEDYEQMAISLAREPERLAALKAKLAANRSRTPLFDTARYTRHLEWAFEAVHARQMRGEAPRSLAVLPIGA